MENKVSFHLKCRQIYRQGCRNAQANTSSSGSSSHNWPISGLRWVGASKELLHGGLNLFPVNDSVRGRCSSPEKDAEQIEEEQLEEDGSVHFSEGEGMPRRFRHDRGDIQEDRKLQRCRAQQAGPSPQSPPHSTENLASSGKQVQAGAADRTSSHKSVISKVPLRLQIKVCGQRGSLGISIAGGKGSLPYKERDEGIFISRVSKGGPSEKAGVHIGDRVLEVNGLDMQEVSHHEAVTVLRNAGSCIKMKVMRERAIPRLDACRAQQESTVAVTAETDILMSWQLVDLEDGRQRPKAKQPGSEPSVDCDLTKRIEAGICNGNGGSDLQSDLNWSFLKREPEVSFKSNALQVVKNTMTIPRIILTHPSTSDEDVEPLTQDPDSEALEDFEDPDSHIHSECFNSAFYPP
eukprot:XP_014069473.1 PREDICTED: uncharacterized protein LOC106612641 [Salmo salar]